MIARVAERAKQEGVQVQAGNNIGYYGPYERLLRGGDAWSFWQGCSAGLSALGIEADGEIWHNNFDKIAKDKKRDSELANNGWIILRFTDKELNDHPNDVLNVIMQGIRKRTGQSNNPEEQTL